MATIIGTSSNNYLSGTNVADIIDGSAGSDTMVGGLGNDTYYVDSTYDVVIEGVDAGTDRVYAYTSYTLGANVEHLYLLGSAYYGYGNALNNSIVGNNSNNYLNGGAGRDWMAGGLGSDSYVVDTTSDVISEGVDAGTDSVYAYDSYILSANVENLYLYGSAYSGLGNSLNNSLVGNAGNNYLWGGTGHDVINGVIGIDTMVGGDGNDIYYVDNEYDVINESFNAGTDSVYSSSILYILRANIENLYLSESALGGKGNELNNYIEGTTGNNGFEGGDGVDTMAGGLGNDAYELDSTTDVIIEGVDAGTDRVYAYSITSYTLGENVEDLYIRGTTYSGYGNALNNYIKGNTGHNLLNGGAGNDTITEVIDINRDFTIGNGNDSIIGGDGNDSIIGGVGSDVLTGGAGADYFTFNSAGEGIDTINDFRWQEGDKIVLSSSGFGNLQTPGGSLAPSEFGTRILYNSSTGALSFDQDGTGAAFGPVQFATLSTRPFLISSDFQVIA